MNSISQKTQSEHILRLYPGQLTSDGIVDQVGEYRSAILQEQYEGRVLSLVIHDLAAVAPAAGESIVMELVADVWRQAEEHLAKASRTGWAHISWFVQNAVTEFIDGLRPQMAGC
ncbi:hypothetical protein [Kitasatospora sp. MBT66]|uniref:hypothetical protein n=1 Tax=Kitasatospora sp. MBT66 TaxID=1444769 RepID=UPI0005B8763F|nr:hypothetical protein [Kitasatospora sp. MBT66]